MARTYAWATHAQVLYDHADVAWIGAIDRNVSALEALQAKYDLEWTATSAQRGACQADIVVLATPPGERLADLSAFRGVRGVVVEKPLGRNLEEAEAFADYCSDRNISVQVNYWRRSDRLFKSLAQGELEQTIGEIQFINGVFCNGFRNNAPHLVDFVRMLGGEIVEVRSLSSGVTEGIAAIALKLKTGVVATLHNVDAQRYRENGLDIWGRDGRLSLLVEGLVNRLELRQESRATVGDYEIAVDGSRLMPTTAGTALYDLWVNFLSHLEVGSPLDSPLHSALITERVLAAVEQSHDDDGNAYSVRNHGL